VAPLIIVACSSARYSTDPGAATLVLPARFGEGQGEPGNSASAKPAPAPSPSASTSAAPAPSASAAEPTPTPVAPSNAPDPTPQRSATQVQYELELKDGTITVVSVTPVKLAEPIVTPRRVGRYAIELTIGKELIERLRFDFPATAADEPQLGTKKSLNAPLTLSQHAIGHLKLLLPQNPRVRRAALIDRATNTATELPWPLPPPPPAPASASATASGAPIPKP
jgi:hypothetical protein